MNALSPKFFAKFEIILVYMLEIIFIKFFYVQRFRTIMTEQVTHNKNNYIHFVINLSKFWNLETIVKLYVLYLVQYSILLGNNYFTIQKKGEIR